MEDYGVYYVIPSENISSKIIGADITRRHFIMSDYKPPFEMTETIANLTAEIAELAGEISVYEGLTTNPKLRRENRIRTIHSSLAIEQNTLTIDQVTDVINGKRVLAPPADIKEVKNAYEIYNRLDALNPLSMDDLLVAHEVMMNDLIKEAGRFRSKNAGVYAEETLVHAGTPANYVPEVMNDLFDWLEKSSLHPIIKACIFHYEFEFIHPFADGNGRIGRLWHTLILSKWKPFFAWVPVESLIHDNQQEYYDALGKANHCDTINPFVEYMLQLLKEALLEIKTTTQDVGENVGENVGDNEKQLLELLQDNPKLSATKAAKQVGLSSRQVERIIKRLKDSGKLVRHGSDRGGYWEVVK